MRAMILRSPKPVSERPLELCDDLPIPEPGKGELRLRNLVCGVCHTDLHTVEGDLILPKIPIVPGHQIVGIVEAVGDGVDKSILGQKVGLAWMYMTCGNCHYCLKGSENLCEHARFTGFHVMGGFAQYTLARAGFVYSLPENFSEDQLAPLLCAGVIGYRALRLSGALSGGTLGIFGFGASAHIAIQIAGHAGCRVIVFTRSRDHQEHAIELGAAWAGLPTDNPLYQMDNAIIFSPAGEHVSFALRNLKPGGNIACAGITMSDIPSISYSNLYMEKRIMSVANATRKDAAELLDLASKIPIKTQVESLPLEMANEALERVKWSRIRGALILRISH